MKVTEIKITDTGEFATTMREAIFGVGNPTSQRAKDTAVLPEYPHVMFRNIEYYNEALAYAKDDEKAVQSLKNQLARLERICVNWEETVEVAPDSVVPHSFYFVAYNKEGKAVSNGGIILHGINVNANVELDPQPGLYWSTHT
jgi:hypothetical protein